MLRGFYEHTIDDKGRLSLPAKHRDELGEIVILGRGLDGQLNVYPVQTWERAARSVGQLNQARKAVRDLKRLLYTIAECQVDRQGRIVIPPPFRALAQLDTNVVIVAMEDRLEIWSQERFEGVWAAGGAEGSELAESLVESGLWM
jgi:MraZ protein